MMMKIFFLILGLFISEASFSSGPTRELTPEQVGYCNSADPEIANTSELLPDLVCNPKILSLEDNLDLDLEPGKSYELELICSFYPHLRSLYFSNLEQELPQCIYSLENLFSLNFFIVKQVDLSGLNNISELKVLGISNANIVKGVLSHPNLETFRLNSVKNHDSLTIGKLASISEVTISGLPKLENIDRFYNLKDTKWLDISDLSDLKDLSALKHFTNLEHLTIGNIYHEVKFPKLDNHPHLEDLRFLFSYFNYLEQISELPNVKNLNINSKYHTLTDISPLSNLTSLEKINVNWHNIIDFAPLANNPNLKYVGHAWGNNQFSDLTQFYAQSKSNAKFSDIKHQRMLYCSPRSREDYDNGKRCNEQQNKHCSLMSPGLLRHLCTFWHDDWF